MLYLASKGKMTREERLLLSLIGIGTIAYNGRNYLLLQQEQNAA